MHQADVQAGSGHWQFTMALCLRFVIAGILLVMAYAVFRLARGGDTLTLEQAYLSALHLRDLVHSNYWQSVLVFMLAYIVLALWLPVTAILTLCAGFLFGTLQGLLYVLAAATLTALTSFCASRYLIGNWIQQNCTHRLRRFNENLARFGAEYLIIVRLIPMMPFALVNALAGITTIRVSVFAWTTALGLLPGVVVFSYLGQYLPEITSANDLWSWKVIGILIAMRLSLFLTVLLRFSIVKKKMVSV